MEPRASWVENDFESRPVEHLKDIIEKRKLYPTYIG
jgi:hypothetical protein